MSHGWPRSPPPTRVRGRVTTKGRPAKQKDRPEKDLRREGLRGGLRRGAGSPEPQDRGEDAAWPGARRLKLPTGAEKGEAWGPLSE